MHGLWPEGLLIIYGLGDGQKGYTHYVMYGLWQEGITHYIWFG